MSDHGGMLRYLLLTALSLSLAFAAEVAGTWKIHSEASTGQKTDAVLEIREDWGAWNAVLIIEDDKLPLKAVNVEGDKLTFEVATDEATYKVQAVVKGDKIEGTFTSTDGTKGTLQGQRQ
jgi:DsbC/DsbD-like thiol-disulfide interchange protein